MIREGKMNKRISFLALSGLTLAVGCQPTDLPDHADSNLSSYGYFEGEVVASWDSGGRTMTLREDFFYVDPYNRRWSAPAGSVVDGASIPAAFWTIVGGPFEGRYRKASVVHDVGCHEMTASWEDVHRMFFDACVCGGVDLQTAKILYYAVYHFGPRWEPVVETVLETHPDAQGQPVQEQVQRRGMRRTRPAPPTAEEVQQVVELIEEENPAPAVLEDTTREELRRRPRRGRNYHRGNPMEMTGNNANARTFSRRSDGRLTDSSTGTTTASQPGTPPSEREQLIQNQNSQPTEQSGDRAGISRRDRTRDRSSAATMTEQEKRWVIQQVRDCLVNQPGQQVPDEYEIERTREGYRVALRYYERNERNEPVGVSSWIPTARVSENGQVLEIR